jgi:hypothetical protein
MGFGGFVSAKIVLPCSTESFVHLFLHPSVAQFSCDLREVPLPSKSTIKILTESTFHESRPASDLKETMCKNSKPKIKRADWHLSYEEKTKQWTAWDSKTIAKRFHALNLWFAILNKGFFQLAHRLITSPRRPGETKSRVWWTTWTPPPTSKTSRTFFQQLLFVMAFKLTCDLSWYAAIAHWLVFQAFSTVCIARVVLSIQNGCLPTKRGRWTFRNAFVCERTPFQMCPYSAHLHKFHNHVYHPYIYICIYIYLICMYMYIHMMHRTIWWSWLRS